MTSKDTQTIEEPPNKEFAPIVEETSLRRKRAAQQAQHRNVPPRLCLSQNNSGTNASQNTANYISTQPNSPCACTTDTGQTGDTHSPPTCPNTSHSLDTHTKNHENKKKKVLHTVTERTAPAITPLSSLCQGSETETLSSKTCKSNNKMLSIIDAMHYYALDITCTDTANGDLEGYQEHPAP
eukprot:1140331-Pelagomonas_calceolata.AAC.4